MTQLWVPSGWVMHEGPSPVVDDVVGAVVVAAPVVVGALGGVARGPVVAGADVAGARVVGAVVDVDVGGAEVVVDGAAPRSAPQADALKSAVSAAAEATAS